ncbi:transposase-like protein [Paraburkholderia sp. BL23I1N1]|nr:transposase-like protein [Paraburkholderia sp. BL23I1N1]
MTKPRTYTPELREEAVKLVLAQGLTLDEAAKRIAIPMGTLATWVKAAKLGNGAVTAPGSRTVAELEAEVARLRRELAETRMERDIVKNRPTRLGAALMNRNFRGVHLMRAETVAVCFLEARPRQKTWPRGSCGLICGGVFGRPRSGN